MISSVISRFEFTNRRALFLSAHKAAVYHWQDGELGSSYLFDFNEEGREHFERYLRETSNTPFFILVDLFEEEFKRDTIPHVFGPDRDAIIQRKLARLFRDTPYCNFDIQGREEGGRRDDRVLFSAVTNPDLLEPWISLLHKYKVPLAGVNSLSLFTKSILKLIPDASDNVLIVSLQSVSGLRQTFFHNNEFRVSRLVNMPRYGTQPYAPYIATEVEKIHRYLSSLRLISPDDPLDVYFLSNGELLGELKQKHADTDGTRYHFLDINELSESSGSKKTVSSPFSDQFFVRELLRQRPRNAYAPKVDTRYFGMRRMRYSMLMASMVLIIGSFIWSGFNLFSGLTYKQNSIAAEKKAQFYSTRYQIARERLPQTPVEPVELQAAVELVETLNEYKTTPLDMVKLISTGLNRYQNVQLDNIKWVASTDPNLDLSKKQESNNTRNKNVVGYSKVNTDGAKYSFYHIALISCHLEPFNGNYRDAIATVNEFAETIRSQQAVYDVSITTLPLDVSSEVNMSGNTKVAAKEANFSMRIVLGIGNEA